jgi:hypothetical protein
MKKYRFCRNALHLLNLSDLGFKWWYQKVSATSDGDLKLGIKK